MKIRDEDTVKNKAMQLAVDTRCSGCKEALGPRFKQSEGTKLWCGVITEGPDCDTQDMLIAVVDGLKGVPEAITAVFPHTVVQTCIVRLIRHSMLYAS